MKFLKKYPNPALAPFLRYYWYFEIAEHELPFTQPAFPYGTFEIICYLENPNTMRWLGTTDEFTEPAIFYAGQLTRPFVMTFNKKCRCVGASLYPWAGSHLYGMPANEFTNELVPLDDLEKDTSFYARLKSCSDSSELFVCLESYLAAKLHDKQNDCLVYHLAKQVIGNPTREALNCHLVGIGLSRRRIEQRFANTTGLSMGAFTRKVRFQKAVHLLESEGAGANLTNIGLQAGYYDQAHFINDFKDFAGASPKSFIQQKTELRNFLDTLVLVN